MYHYTNLVFRSLWLVYIWNRVELHVEYPWIIAFPDFLTKLKVLKSESKAWEYKIQTYFIISSKHAKWRINSKKYYI